MHRGLFAVAIIFWVILHSGPDAYAAAKCKAKTLKVAIDIGHSRRDPGAISATGTPEYSFNKRFATEFVKHNSSSKKLKLVTINSSGRPIGLRERTRKAAIANADVFLSFHHDSVNRKYLSKWTYKGKTRNYSDKFRGYSIFVSTQNPRFNKSFELAKLIGVNMKAAGLTPTLHHAEPIKGENRKLLQKSLGVYDAPFAVLRFASMPSVLVELGIILNRDEEKLLNTPAHRLKLIKSITSALELFCAD